MIPGMGKLAKDVDINDSAFKKVEAVIQSMTPKERMNPDLINTSRKNRIALGCGQSIADINAFIKQFDQMRKMMQKISKNPSMGMPQFGPAGRMRR
jgi:signal recognition particle subunit SRP54